MVIFHVQSTGHHRSKALLLLLTAAVISGCARFARPGALPEPSPEGALRTESASAPGSGTVVRDTVLAAGPLSLSPEPGIESAETGSTATTEPLATVLEPPAAIPEPTLELTANTSEPETEPPASETDPASEPESEDHNPESGNREPESEDREPTPEGREPEPQAEGSVSEFLDAHLSDFLSARGVDAGSVGISYKNGRTGDAFSYNGDRLFYAASTVKVAGAMYCYDQAAAGALDLSRCLVYDAAQDYEDGSGVLRWEIQDGDALPLDRLIDLSILDSDNIAAQMIFRYWREQPEQLSLSTRLHLSYGLSYEQAGQVTSNEMLALLERLVENPDQNPHYDHLKVLLHGVHFDGYTTRGLPGDRVMRKYGAYGAARSEIAVVELPGDGGDYYYLTCYTDGAADAEAVMADLGREIYSRLAGPA